MFCTVAVTVSISLTAATTSFASDWRLDVKAWMYLRHALVITSALTNLVVVIASSRPLASMSDYALHKPGPSLQIVSKQSTIERKEALKYVSSINPLDPLCSAHALKLL